MTEVSTNRARKWGIEPIPAEQGILTAKRMGPGPYRAIPLAFITASGERTLYTFALWIPELSGSKDGSLSAGEHGDLLRRCRAESYRLMVRLLYVGPAKLEAQNAAQRSYLPRLTAQHRVELYATAQEVIDKLIETDTVEGKSLRELRDHTPIQIDFGGN